MSLRGHGPAQLGVTRPRAVQLGIVAVLVVQCVRGVRLGASDFERSYWLVTYAHGFVRRGLGGELLRLLPGPLTEGTLLVAVQLTSLVPAALLAVLVWRLAAAPGVPARLLALLLAASPASLLSVLDKHRPDQVGLAVLVLLALAPERHYVRWTIAVLLGIAVLVHEGSLLMFGSFALPLLVRANTRRAWLRATAFYVPAALAAAAVLLGGRASEQQWRALAADPAAEALLSDPYDKDLSVLPYLGDSLTDAFASVSALSAERLWQMGVFGLILVAVHGAWLAASGVRAQGPLTAWIPPLAALILVYATGVDWQRWAASAILATLVVLAGQLLAAQLLDADSPRRVAAPRWPVWWLAALYLASRPPAPSVAWRTGWEGLLGFWTWPF